MVDGVTMEGETWPAAATVGRGGGGRGIAGAGPCATAGVASVGAAVDKVVAVMAEVGRGGGGRAPTGGTTGASLPVVVAGGAEPAAGTEASTGVPVGRMLCLVRGGGAGTTSFVAGGGPRGGGARGCGDTAGGSAATCASVAGFSASGAVAALPPSPAKEDELCTSGTGATGITFAGDRLPTAETGGTTGGTTAGGGRAANSPAMGATTTGVTPGSGRGGTTATTGSLGGMATGTGCPPASIAPGRGRVGMTGATNVGRGGNALPISTVVSGGRLGMLSGFSAAGMPDISPDMRDGTTGGTAGCFGMPGMDGRFSFKGLADAEGMREGVVFGISTFGRGGTIFGGATALDASAGMPALRAAIGAGGTMPETGTTIGATAGAATATATAGTTLEGDEDAAEVSVAVEGRGDAETAGTAGRPTTVGLGGFTTTAGLGSNGDVTADATATLSVSRIKWSEASVFGALPGSSFAGATGECCCSDDVVGCGDARGVAWGDGTPGFSRDTAAGSLLGASKLVDATTEAPAARVEGDSVTGLGTGGDGDSGVPVAFTNRETEGAALAGFVEGAAEALGGFTEA